MKKIICLIALISLISSFVACEKADIIQSKEAINENELKNNSVIENFAIALAKVLSEHKECRELIKTEALKKIDYDYDVLYVLVKDIKLSDGNTLEKHLLELLKPEELSLIISDKPTLTIFIPTLPENVFSAELWNIETEIPQVAIRSTNPNTFVYDAKGAITVIKSNQIPAFPVVVLKDNERIKQVETNNSTLRSAINDYNFEFIDSIFNNVERHENKMETRIRTSYDHIQKSLDSYQIFNNSTEGWQRDYVYYNLTKEINKGPFDSSYREGIVGFELLGDAHSNYKKISDSSGEPILDGVYHEVPIGPGRGYLTPWTDGEFEFQVKCYFGNKNAGITEYTNRFRCNPNQLFKMNLKPNKNYTKYTILGYENLLTQPRLPLFDWNIENYSSTVKIRIEEFDLSETIKRATSSTAEFASNFGFDPTFESVVKLGLKFGASSKVTQTVSYEETISVGSDDLGEVIVNFGDNIVMDDTYVQKYMQSPSGSGGGFGFPNLNPNYQKGYYRVYIAPMKQ